MRKKYTFTLAPDVIAEIEKFDETKSGIVEKSLRQYLDAEDKQLSNESVVPAVDYYSKEDIRDILKKTIDLMKLESQKIHSALTSDLISDVLDKMKVLESDMKTLELKLKSDISIEIINMQKEFSKTLDSLHLEGRFHKRESESPGKIPQIINRTDY